MNKPRIWNKKLVGSEMLADVYSGKLFCDEVVDVVLKMPYRAPRYSSELPAELWYNGKKIWNFLKKKGLIVHLHEDSGAGICLVYLENNLITGVIPINGLINANKVLGMAQIVALKRKIARETWYGAKYSPSEEPFLAAIEKKEREEEQLMRAKEEEEERQRIAAINEAKRLADKARADAEIAEKKAKMAKEQEVLRRKQERDNRRAAIMGRDRITVYDSVGRRFFCVPALRNEWPVLEDGTVVVEVDRISYPIKKVKLHELGASLEIGNPLRILTVKKSAGGNCRETNVITGVSKTSPRQALQRKRA